MTYLITTTIRRRWPLICSYSMLLLFIFWRILKSVDTFAEKIAKHKDLKKIKVVAPRAALQVEKYCPPFSGARFSSSGLRTKPLSNSTLGESSIRATRLGKSKDLADYAEAAITVRTKDTGDEKSRSGCDEPVSIAFTLYQGDSLFQTEHVPSNGDLSSVASRVIGAVLDGANLSGVELSFRPIVEVWHDAFVPQFISLKRT